MRGYCQHLLYDLLSLSWHACSMHDALCMRVPAMLCSCTLRPVTCPHVPCMCKRKDPLPSPMKNALTGYLPAGPAISLQNVVWVVPAPIRLSCGLRGASDGCSTAGRVFYARMCLCGRHPTFSPVVPHLAELGGWVGPVIPQRARDYGTGKAGTYILLAELSDQKGGWFPTLLRWHQKRHQSLDTVIIRRFSTKY